MTQWTVHLETDPETGELIMPLPTDLLSQMGWDFGTELIWEEMNDGGWSLRRKSDAAVEDATERAGRSHTSTVDKGQ